MLELANSWQRGFPLMPRPFAEIGRQCGLAEQEVLQRFLELKARGMIDRIGPVFPPHTLGASTLAAIAVPPERLAEVAAFVSDQPGVNHNYEREHAYNLWFVVHGASNAEVESTLTAIERATGLAILRLPLLEEFHVDLGFDLDTHAAPRGVAGKENVPLSPEERNLAKALARGLPLVPAPYEAVARSIGSTEAEVIDRLGKMLAGGRIRRIGAVIRHRRVGYEANAMMVWNVPEDLVGEVGRRMASDPAVTLCYRRARSLPEWPYNLYCMVHGRQRGRVLYEAKRICAAYGLSRLPRAVLFSRRCFTQRAANYG
ncbi:MAG TPA: Lrp/AsnC family transcriptional regulator [Burkholderiales bacterium]|nr:Lrp/AsnC family transcriptional regulator [Burkholderiales bacterium]